MMMKTLLQLALQFLFRLSPEETIQLLHHLNSCMSKIAEEKAAKEREFLSPSLHSQEGNTDKEDTAKSLITGSMIIQEWFLKYHTTILLNPRKAKSRLYAHASEVHDSIISPTNLIANKGLKQGYMIDYDLFVEGVHRKNYSINHSTIP